MEQAGDELREVLSWGEEEAERVREYLCDALPEISLAIRDKKVSHRNLSPEKAVQAYIAILKKFIARSEVSKKKRTSKRKGSASKVGSAKKRSKKAKAKLRKAAKKKKAKKLAAKKSKKKAEGPKF